MDYCEICVGTFRGLLEEEHSSSKDFLGLMEFLCCNSNKCGMLWFVVVVGAFGDITRCKGTINTVSFALLR